MKSNIILVLCFVAGLALGYWTGLAPILEEYPISNILLCLLMFTVGISVGSDEETIKGFRKLNKRVLALPFLTILGTAIGGVIAALIFSQKIFPTLAISAGMAYYSLSSIIITEKLGVALGAVALLTNIFRELMAILFAPLLAKYFGPYAPIAAGGATTMDVTLPSILKASGKAYLVPSVYHGFICDFSVPIMVTLFVELAVLYPI